MRSLLALLFACIPAYSQATTATLGGTVRDPAGALVSKAGISVTSEDTGVRREATAGNDGSFTVPLLPPGRYTVRAAHPGFTPAEAKGVTLHVGDQVSLTLSLAIAGITESVVVTESPARIDTSPAVSAVFNERFVQNLPLNGRSFQSLIAFSPGVVLTKTNFQEQGQFSVNGQRANANYFTVDGVSANIHVSVSARLEQTGGGSIPGVSANGSTSNLVSMEALQEFRIQTSSYAPEFGRTPGAQVSIVTRSGANQFHGALFEYFRNDVLDANDWFANRSNISKPPIRQNDFGGAFGGPVVRDRAFFFGSFEGLRLRQPQTRLTDVPSMSTRKDAPPQLQAYLNAYPVPNGRETANGFAQFAASYSDPSSLNAASVRIDHALTRQVNLFGRYNRAPSELQTRCIDATSVNTVTTEHFRTETGTAGATLLLSPRMVDDLRVNWSRTRSDWYSALDGFGGAVPPPLSAWFPASVNPAASLLVFRPGGNAADLYVGRNVDNASGQFNLVDSLSLSAGTHQLKLGADYRRLTPTLGIRNYSQFVNFSGALNLAAGKVSSGYVETYAPAPLLFQNFSAYAQDTWKATARFTLTYGLRWEVNPAPSARGEKVLFRGIGMQDPATMAIGPGPIYNTRYANLNTRYANLAPRLGLVYLLRAEPGRELLVRGGVGRFYDMGNGPAGNVASNFPNAIRANFPANTIYPLDAALAAPPALRSTPPVGVFGFRAFDPDLQLARTYQWNLALEQSLGVQQHVSATYIAAIGRKILRSELIPNPSPNIGGNVVLVRNGATSDYHALQIRFERRLAAGLQALAGYTWSHSIDIASNDSSSMIRADALDPRLDRASSDFDTRHALTGAVSYALPRARSFLLREWSIDTVFVARSSTPVNVTTGVANLYGLAPRPNRVAGQPLYISDPNVGGARRYNAAAFVAPPANQQGTLSRNALESFPVWQIDMAARREFPVSERVRLQLRLEMFNVLNHPNFGDPVASLSSGLFGQADRTLARTLSPGGGAGFNPLYQLGGARSMQAALRLQF